jgi:hypothetical protein
MTECNENNIPISGKHKDLVIHNFDKYWKLHPNNNIDLCAMAIQPFLSDAKKIGINFHYQPLSFYDVPTENQLQELSALEEIVMIGYPNGLWDQINNKPIFRKGITATHPGTKYNGKEEFVIDAACFPGSSGSPVFILNEGMYLDKKKRTLFSKDRVLLLGTLYAGPQQTINGDIEIVEVPVVQKPIAVSRIQINLGYVIRSTKLKELEQLF